MSNYPDMREMAKLATENYRHIESIEQIRPPYPARGTPNWWALRMRYEDILFAKVRRDRKGERLGANRTLNRTVGAEIDHERHCHAAKWAALGNEDATLDYERAGQTREWWLHRWNPAALVGDRNHP